MLNLLQKILVTWLILLVGCDGSLPENPAQEPVKIELVKTSEKPQKKVLPPAAIDTRPLFNAIPAELTTNIQNYHSKDVQIQKILARIPDYENGLIKRIHAVENNIASTGKLSTGDSLLPAYMDTFWKADFFSDIPGFSDLDLAGKEKFISDKKKINNRARASLKKDIKKLERMKWKMDIMAESNPNKLMGKLGHSYTVENSAICYIIQQLKILRSHKK